MGGVAGRGLRWRYRSSHAWHASNAPGDKALVQPAGADVGVQQRRRRRRRREIQEGGGGGREKDGVGVGEGEEEAGAFGLAGGLVAGEMLDMWREARGHASAEAGEVRDKGEGAAATGTGCGGEQSTEARRGDAAAEKQPSASDGGDKVAHRRAAPSHTAPVHAAGYSRADRVRLA